MKLLFIIFCLITSVTAQTHAIEEGWKGIKLLQTSRAEVEHILGVTAEEINPVDVSYRTKEGLVHIAYSHNPCSNDGDGRFKVARDTVIGYRVSLKRFNFADLEWSKELYDRHQDTHSLNLTHYYNSKDGIRITTNKTGQKEMILTIYFEGTRELSSKFLCKCEQ